MMECGAKGATLRICFGALIFIGAICPIASVNAEEFGNSAPVTARLGILLDTSAEMGFLVPQVRKEIRHLNAQLEQLGRLPVEFLEIDGAAIERESSLSVPARRNVLFALKKLYEKSGCDTVYWITALRRYPSGNGLFAVENLLQEQSEGRPRRRLIIRNIWQDQIQAGDRWVRQPPAAEIDPLDPRSRPSDWYQLAETGAGRIIRSWQFPPEEFRPLFGFPARITQGEYLKKLGLSGGEAQMDMSWERDLARDHGLHFGLPNEEWPRRLTGRRWLFETCLVPFISDETFAIRAEAVFKEISDRETIEEDLARIPEKRIGVIFGIGYLKNDLERLNRMEGRPLSNWKLKYTADLARIVAETREHQRAFQSRDRTDGSERGYVSEFIELIGNNKRHPGPDPHAIQMAKLVREAEVDAIYFFTDGHVGGGDYGTWGIDEDLITLAIREAGIPLYLRVPFEFGPAPISLQSLALASGGGLFLGKVDDEDWNIAIPSSAWPEPKAEELAR